MSTPLRKWLVLLVLYGCLCLNGNVYAQNTKLSINAGTTFKVASNVLVLQSTDLQADGILDAGNARVVVTGASNTSFGGPGVPAMRQLDLNTSSSSTMTLQSWVKVSGTLNFQQGIINLNNHLLQLTSAGVLQNEGEATHITGPFGGQVSASSISVNRPMQLNIGNLGAVLTSNANLGKVTITRTHKAATNPINSALKGIQRTYLIQPQNNTGLNATLRFYYLDEELNGDDPNTLTLWKSTNGVTWMQIGVDTRDMTNKYVEKTGLADLSYWTLTDLSDPLPLILASFNVICKYNQAIVGWRTGEESMLKGFEVERSTDGTTWTTLGSVNAVNNPSGSQYYFTDTHPLASAWYRLKIIDMSGSYSYSPSFTGGCADLGMPLTVYPNPAEGQAVASISVRQETSAVVQITDMSGQLLHSANWQLQPGTNQYRLPVANLTAGSYIVKVLYPGSTDQQAILIKK